MPRLDSWRRRFASLDERTHERGCRDEFEVRANEIIWDHEKTTDSVRVRVHDRKVSLGCQRLSEFDADAVYDRAPDDERDEKTEIALPVRRRVRESVSQCRVGQEVSPFIERDQIRSGVDDGFGRGHDDGENKNKPGNPDNERPPEPSRQQRNSKIHSGRYQRGAVINTFDPC